MNKEVRDSGVPSYDLFSLITKEGESIGGAFSSITEITGLWDHYGPIDPKFWKSAINEYKNMAVSYH